MNNQPMTLRQHHPTLTVVIVICRILLTIGIVGCVIVCAVALDAQGSIHTPHLTVNRHAVVQHSTLPHCHVEDGSSGPLPCTWNIGPGRDGNGRGLSYWVNRHHHVVYVWRTDPTANHPARRWVTSALADALAEGMGRHAGTRDWQRCWFTAKGPEQLQITVGCPNGQRITS